VLPFQNMSGDPEQEYFADGMVEEITTALSHIPSLFVIVRNSAFTYKGRTVDVRQVGRELGVRYVLEGSVRKAGSRVRITGQLVEAASGSHVWADRFDGTLADVFDLQDQVAARVVAAIRPNLQHRERTFTQIATDHAWRYDLLAASPRRGAGVGPTAGLGDARLHGGAHERFPRQSPRRGRPGPAKGW
jgi:adenylate cyclase